MILLIIKFFGGLILVFLIGHFIGYAIEKIFHTTLKSFKK